MIRQFLTAGLILTTCTAQQTLDLVEGDTFVFTCHPGVLVREYFTGHVHLLLKQPGDQVIYSNKEPKMTSKFPRETYTCDITGKDGVAQFEYSIKSLSVSDSGVWQCVSSVDGVLDFYKNITISVEPAEDVERVTLGLRKAGHSEYSAVLQSGNQNLTELITETSGPFEVECSADGGYPTPMYKIYKNGQELSSNRTNTLHIELNTIDESLSCFVKNRDFPSYFVTFRLKIYEGCIPGWYGEECKFQCGHCFNGRNCYYVDGRCPDVQSPTCEAGWTGDHCQEVCDTGYFGDSCVQTCGRCKDGEACHPVHGRCVDGCEPGYTGDLCIDLCDQGYFGENCSNVCGKCKGDKPCKSTDGLCLDGCAPGYQGERCLEGCPGGFFGDKCAQPCGMCKNKTVCHRVNGTCKDGCDPGFKGDTCFDLCDDAKYFGANCAQPCGKCKNGKPCRRISGICVDGCEPGYKGDTCFDECDAGYFGDKCVHRCGMCKNGSSCNHVNGYCAEGCEPGFQGNRCFDLCADARYFGANCAQPCGKCRNGQPCRRVNGNCLDRCAPGYKGDKCLDPCDAGYFGESCVKVCGKCKEGAACHHVSGLCAYGCDVGYKGSTCTDACDQGFYGANCKQKCGYCRNGVACNRFSGACPSSAECEYGWNGTLCKTESQKTTVSDEGKWFQLSSSFWIGVGAGTIVVILVAVGAYLTLKRHFLFCKYRHEKRRKKQSPEVTSSVQETNMDSSSDPVYEEINEGSIECPNTYDSVTVEIPNPPQPRRETM